jgi:hypothetical protein
LSSFYILGLQLYLDKVKYDFEEQCECSIGFGFTVNLLKGDEFVDIMIEAWFMSKLYSVWCLARDDFLVLLLNLSRRNDNVFDFNSLFQGL